MVKGVGTQSFIQLLRTTYQERQVYLHLYRATSSTYSTVKPLWSGYLIMDLGSGEDVSFPYEQNLTFVDGLSVLKEIDFVQFPEGSPPSTPSDPNPIPFEDRTLGNYAPENMYWGPARYTYWIKEILLKSGAATTSQGASLDYGFTTAVNWYNGVMTSTSQSSDPLYLTESQASMFHTKDENNFFKPENCYEVLKELMRHWGCRITYWKHEFWIVQIPEYIEDESGFIDNPDNINSRQYNKSGTYLGSQDHLGDTYYTRYEQTIQSNQISKLVGTKYNYLPAIHRADATFLSLNSENHYGGFPFGSNATTKDIFQGRILNPSNADFLWVSVPLNWEWDMTGTSLPNGHTGGWWCSIKFNLYAFQKVGNTTTTYYLQYDSSSGNYYWIEEANWVPLGNTSPKYIIKSRNLTETDYIGFQEQIPFEDSSGNAISMTGQWDFYMSLEDYGTSSSTPGSFYCRFSGYQQSNFYSYIKRNPTLTTPYLPTTSNVSGSGPQTLSGKVSWTNSLQDNTLAQAIPNIQQNPSGYNTGSSYNMDIKYNFVSPLKGFLQVLTTSQNSTYGFTNNTQITNSTNTESFSFGDLVWGDTVQSTARGMLGVYNGSDFVKTNPNGQWGRGTLSGTQTFTQILIDEFLTGQIKVLISPNMRLVVGEQNKDQTATASGGGTATRPRFVNPIGRLREFRTNAYDPEYIFRRGSFYSLFDEWDYEGYEILRDTITVTTVTNDIGGLGGAQDDAPIASAKLQGPVTSALMMNSPVAYVRQTVAATGSNVAVNGNFNVATGWTLGTGWSIDTTAKKANFTATGSTSDLTQSVLTQEKTFQINFTVVVTAGTLLVKAGSSGTTETITASGDYSIYLDCEGSSVIKFQAGTTFTGSITHVHIAEQKSLSSLPINSLGTTVFKTNDTFNLINSKGGEILPLTVSSNQGASDDTISVTSTALYDDIGIDSVLLINQDDLSAQYQNKTKGTVGGFDITATSIDSGSVAISSYIDDDTFATASATSLATSESIKAYVDTQVGSADTLSEVLANGNTTGGTDIVVSSGDKIIGPSVFEIMSEYSNRGRITLLSSTAAATTSQINFLTDGNVRAGITKQGNFLINTTTDSGEKLRVEGNVFIHNSNATLKIQEGTAETYSFVAGGTSLDIKADSTTALSIFQNAYVGIGTSSPSYLLTVDSSNSSGPDNVAFFNSASNNERILIGSVNQYIEHKGSEQRITLASEGSAGTFTVRTNGSERARITSDGRLGIGTSSPSSLLEVNGNTTTGNHFPLLDNVYDLGAPTVRWEKLYTQNISDIGTGNVGIGTTNPTEKLHVVGDALITGDSHADAFKPAVSGNPIKFKNFDSSTEFARITDSGNVLIGGTTDLNSAIKLQLTNSADNRIQITTSNGFSDASLDLCNTSDNKGWRVIHRNNTNFEIQYASSLSSGIIGGVSTALAIDSSLNTTLSGSLTGTTATFSGQVSAGTHFKLQSGGKLYSNASNVTLQSASGSYLGFNISTSEKMRLNDTGLGIGTTSPVGRLTVIDSTASSTLQKFHVGRGTTAGLSITDDDATAYIKAIQDENESGYGNLTLMADDQNNKDGYISFNGTAGVERARITSGGNLLIGTTTDGGYKLNVNGTTVITDNLFIDRSSDGSIIFNTSGVNKFLIGYDSSPDGFRIYNYNTSSASLFIEKTTNNVGIGTATPSRPLHVKNTSSQTVAVFDGGNNSAGEIGFLGNGTSGDTYVTIGAVANDMSFSAGASERMRLTSAGRLGIGTTSPSDKLQVQDGYIRVAYSGGAAFKLVPHSSNDGYGFYDAVNLNYDMWFDGGNVGIGTTSPIYALDVNGNFQLNGEIFAASGVDLSLRARSGQNIIFKADGTEKMRLTSDGRLGILTTSPNAPLEVNGNARFGDSSTGIRFSIGGTDEYKVEAMDVAGTAWNSLHLKADGNDGLFLQKDTNNVGIGTTSPAQNFVVADATNGNGVELVPGATGTIQTFNRGTSSYNNLNIDTASTRIRSIDYTSFHNGSGFSEKMRLTSGGNLLIGTTTDDTKGKIQVSDTGTSGVTGHLSFYNDNNAYTYLALKSGSNTTLFGTHEYGNGYVTATNALSLGSNHSSNSSRLWLGNNSRMMVAHSDGTEYLRVSNNGNLLIGTTTDVGVPLYVNGVIRAVGGGIQAAQDYGFTLNDESGSNRYGLKFGAAGSVGGSNLLMLTNRSLNSATGGGEVAIGGNTNTSGVSEVEIARFIPRVTATSGTQKKVSLDAVLELTEQTAPANPASGESIIWMDSESGDLKVKINYGGTTVTRTLAAFEG